MKDYLTTHEAEVKGLDEESRFMLATIIKEKRLSKQLLRQKESKREEEEENMCQAIQELIEEGRQEGKVEGKAEALLLILSNKGEVTNETANRIRQQMDVGILEKWILLALASESVMNFEAVM